MPVAITPKPIANAAALPAQQSRAPWIALSALGVVFGDLATSPLYTLQTVVQAAGGRFTVESALGILSMIVWTLIIIVSIKYCLVVMRADNHGEGGILALMSLVGANNLKGRGGLLTGMGLLGAALIYGDGVITPAISVLSALEGVNVVTSALKPFVMPMAVLVLLALFAAQRLGTTKIGGAFGPIMLLWCLVIAVLGVSGIVRTPQVLLAIDPRHAIGFLTHAHGTGLLVLGAVFLCITGGEALYADMGHFGRGPIRLSWYGMVLPALLLSYAGQTALLIQKGSIQGNPFFLLAPGWSIYPLVVLSTLATVIASQAIITGSFSMTRQAMQLGWLPGFDIKQTSDKIYGQIYVPVVNGLLMIVTVGITIAFGSSDRLAGAYGTAVSTTMLLTTCLLFNAMRKSWHWPWPAIVLIGGAFLIVDLAFFSANLLKIAQGGWLPLTIGALVFFVMTTWRAGTDAVRTNLREGATKSAAFITLLEQGNVPRVAGTAIFLTRSQQRIPSLIVDHVRDMGALQQHVIALMVLFDETPRTTKAERCTIEYITDGIWHATIRFGFMEIPDLPQALAEANGLDPAIDVANAVYFGARDLVIRKASKSGMGGVRAALFAYLYRNAVKIVDRFRLPPAKVVEVARQIEI
jgi:KUP system potassium uptake protein